MRSDVSNLNLMCHVLSLCFKPQPCRITGDSDKGGVAKVELEEEFAPIVMLILSLFQVLVSLRTSPVPLSWLLEAPPPNSSPPFWVTK